MPINLTAPLAWTRASPDELRMLQSLQGNILKGHGRDFTVNVFFSLDPERQLESRRMLRTLANLHVTSAHRQLLDARRFKETGAGGGAFVHVALAYQGYIALGCENSAPTDADFRLGMKSEGSRAALNDPDLDQWEAPFRHDIHGVVLVAHETEARVAALTATIRELVEHCGGTVIHVQHGKALRNAEGIGIEHFGYVDGRSQPLLLQEDIDAEIASAGNLMWDPAFPLSTALVRDPGANDPVSCGSFFIFRKLEQHVHDFKEREQKIADRLGLTGADRDLAGALIVGRFEDGTPVTLSDVASGGTPPNDFSYSGDPGLRCPFHAHIRKANPRGSGGAGSEAQERSHMMPRRGIPFEDMRRPTHPEELPEAANLAEFRERVAPLLPRSGVGLLFMAYNAEIARQFMFTQRSWANNPRFPQQPPGVHGIDPVIGQGDNNPGEQRLPRRWDDPSAGTTANVAFSGFVKMRGGEYFFSPSLTFLRTL